MSPQPANGQSREFLDIPHALDAIGDAQAMREMLGMLIELLERDSPEIANLLQAGDLAAANALLHQLKGCIPIFCTSEICQQVVEVEKMTKPMSTGEALPTYAQLLPNLQSLQREITEYLALPESGY